MDNKRMHRLHCNCRKKECSIGGRCNFENVVCQANIFPMENSHGISAGNWKQCLYNHRHHFTNPLFRNQTVLSKCF